MALPRKAEFDANLISADYRLAGAAVWAYGDTHQTFPSPNWIGWDTYVSGGDPAQVLDAEFYYDAGRTYHGIADYTGDAQWTLIARKAALWYLIYVEGVNTSAYAEVPPRGGVAVQFNMPHGLYLEWQRNPDPVIQARMLKALYALANDVSWGTSFPMAWIPDLYSAREISYNIITKYLALDAGYHAAYGFDPWGLDDAGLIGSAFAYCDQAINLLGGGDGGLGVDGLALETRHRYVRPFMMANLATGLMHHFEHTADSRVIPKLTTLFNDLWTVCYRANGTTLNNTLPVAGGYPGGGGPAPATNYQYGINSFTYTNALPPGGVDQSSSGWGASDSDPTLWEYRYWDTLTWEPPKTSALWPTPELNGLVLPIYFWLYQQTGDLTHRNRADLLFDGLVRYSNISSRYGTDTGTAFDNSGKVFNQMYARIWPYVMARRHAGMLALPGSAGSHAIAGGSGLHAAPD